MVGSLRILWKVEKISSLRPGDRLHSGYAASEDLEWFLTLTRDKRRGKEGVSLILTCEKEMDTTVLARVVIELRHCAEPRKSLFRNLGEEEFYAGEVTGTSKHHKRLTLDEIHGKDLIDDDVLTVIFHIEEIRLIHFPTLQPHPSLSSPVEIPASIPKIPEPPTRRVPSPPAKGKQKRSSKISTTTPRVPSTPSQVRAGETSLKTAAVNRASSENPLSLLVTSLETFLKEHMPK